MNREMFEKYKNQRITSILLSSGINPKYKAFGYILYLLREYKTEDIAAMGNKELISVIMARFDVEHDNVVANFKCLITASSYPFGKRSVILDMIPRLAQGEMPSVYEFVIALSCYVALTEMLMQNEIVD